MKVCWFLLPSVSALECLPRFRAGAAAVCAEEASPKLGPAADSASAVWQERPDTVFSRTRFVASAQPVRRPPASVPAGSRRSLAGALRVHHMALVKL